MMASVSGRRMRNTLPEPYSESTSTRPRTRSTFVFTTSMPTPRPEMSVTLVAVEKPGAKMIWYACASVSWSFGPMRPFSRARLMSFSAFRPRPSSRISTRIWPPSWRAQSLTVPDSGLPNARRSSGISMP